MSRYARWEDAMVAQTRLLQDLRSPSGQRFLEHMERALNAQHEPGERMPSGFIRAIQEKVLTEADPVYVSEDVRNVIDVARQSFRPEPPRINDAFTGIGFALFPSPIIIPDAPINDVVGVPVRALSWVPVIDEDDPTIGCFWISFYTHVDDDVLIGRVTEDDPVVAKLRSLTPLSLVHTFQMTFGKEPWKDAIAYFYDEETGERKEIDGVGAERRCPSCLAAVMHEHRDCCSLFRPGDEVAYEDAVSVLSDSTYERGLAQVTLIQAFWRIAQQVFRGPERAPRGIWRDANRKGIPAKDVTVVRLRAYREGREMEPSGRELSVRFIVRGHWHTYHTRSGPVQKWILPYVKGPDDAPLKVTERVFEFVR
jgi:hypothetical protein